MSQPQKNQKNSETINDHVETVKSQFDQLPSDLELGSFPTLFFFQPENKNDHLVFQFDETSSLKKEIKSFLIQADVTESDFKHSKCHFEYYHFTKQWVVLNKSTKRTDFYNQKNYYEIRIRYH